MAGGYRHDPEGEDRFAKRLARQQAQLDELRGRSGVKNAILRGDVLTFQSSDGDLTALVGEFDGSRFDYPDWVADTIRGIQLTKAGDTNPFAHIAHDVDEDRIDVVLGLGETALGILYAQTGEFWISGPGGSQFYIAPSGQVTITAGTGQIVSIVGSAIVATGDTDINGELDVTGNVETGGDVIVGDDLRVDGDVGFYGTSPQSKPTVSGSRAGNAALNDLLNELAGLGLITNSTSA